jgi:hypothetical protein
LAVGVFSSTSPIEGNSIQGVTKAYIFVRDSRASWQKIAEKVQQRTKQDILNGASFYTYQSLKGY